MIDDDVPDPTIDFPYNVADYLADCLRRGIEWEDAWTIELDEAAKLAGFSWKQQPFTVETALDFAKRHLRAAYEGREALRYCADDCGYLALDGEHCLFHGKGRAA